MRVLKGKFASSVFHSCKEKTPKTRILVSGPQCVKRYLTPINDESTICDCRHVSLLWRDVLHLVSFCVFRYPMVLLTYLNLCCGQRKWRNQWMYSLSWQTRRWNKAESMLWRLCSSIALLSACQTQSKCGWKLQEPAVAPAHQDVEQNAE
jgi:hypothetical protein